MSAFTILAIFILAQIIAYKVEKKLADTLPLMCCGFILVLYILAFFRGMSWIDNAGLPIIIVSFFWIWRNGLAKKLLQEFFSIQNICILIFIGLICLSQLGRIATTEEDIAFGATALKALWWLDGFAGKYSNVVPQYGDCPPAIQLFEWFFTHLNTAEYVEGLGYAGYSILIFVLLLPLIDRLESILPIRERVIDAKTDNVGVKVARNKKYYVSDKKLVSKYKVQIKGNNSEIAGERLVPLNCLILLGVNAIACILIYLLPSVVNGNYCRESLADVPLAIIYGLLLLTIYENDQKYGAFYFAKISLYGSVIILCRKSGVEWLIFALIFMAINHINNKKREKYNQILWFENGAKYLALSIFSWLIVLISWIVFCLFNHRVANALYSGVDPISDSNLRLMFYSTDELWTFVKCMLVESVHIDRSWLLDISIAAAMLMFVVALLTLGKKKIISIHKRNMLTAYIVFSGVSAYMLILVCYIPGVSINKSGLSKQEMLSLISNMGAPWILGTIILLIGVYFKAIEEIDDDRPAVDAYVREQITADNYKNVRLMYLIVFICISLCADWKAAYNEFVGYRASLKTDIESRECILDEAEKAFVAEVDSNDELWGKRILYVKNAADYRDDHNVYIGYELSPTAVVFGSASAESSQEDIISIISDSQAKYLYVEDIEGIDSVLDYVRKWEHVDEQNDIRLYRILEDGMIEPYMATVEQ